MTAATADDPGAEADDWVHVPANPDEQLMENRARPPLPPVAGTAVELVERFFATQERRAAIYARFRDDFASHLRGETTAGDYDARVRAITSDMAACSLEAIAIEEALKTKGRDAASASIRVAQMGEKTKLNMTCTLQVLRKAASEGRWSWQRERGAEEEVAAAAARVAVEALAMEEERARDAARARRGGGLRTALNPGWANGNFCAAHDAGGATAAAGAACSCFDSAEDGAGEPTREEYDGATAEATKALEEAVIGINEALQELKYELAEMREEEEEE